MSIRRRMTLTLVGTLLILLGSAGAGLYVYVRSALTRQFDEALVSKARTLQALLRGSDSGRVEFDFSDNTMPEFQSAKAPDYFEIWSLTGTVVERSQSLKKADLKVPPTPPDALWYGDIPLPDGRNGRVVKLCVTPVYEEREVRRLGRPLNPQTFVLVTARDRENLDHTLTTIGVAGTAGVGILSLAFGILIPWLIGRNLRPLATIAAQANRIDASALGTRFPVATMPEELQPICGRLNDSLERLQGAFDRERRFSADVAHELRTPISELRLLSELALKFPKEGTGANRSFTDALDIAKQMEGIVETLLEMMQSDAPVAAEKEATDLAAVAQHSWRAFELKAAEKKLTLQLCGVDEMKVATDSAIMGRIFSNLLSNAVEYAPAESVIEMRQAALSDRLVVTLSNRTTNLAEGDLPHLAEPFWRKDASRTGHSHAGLGLALVACYAKRLNISLKWTLPRPGVFQVVLAFPR